MEQLYLGIDLGTSAMKIVLIDEKKQVVAHTSEAYRLSAPREGWSEIHQEIWFDKLISGIRTVMDGRDAKKLKSIGITGQMHTLVVLDGSGQYIRPAMMWNDLRTKRLMSGLKEKIRSFEEGEYLSRTISIGSPAANLYWLKQYEPENYARIGKFLIGADYLAYRLTGNYGTDFCEASTSCLYELKNRRWSAQMRELLGLDESVYPEVHGSMHVAGTVCRDAADALGIPEAVTVLTGTGDNPATAISTGCLTNGYPVISLGTSGVLVMLAGPQWDNQYGKRILFSFDEKEYFHLVQGTVQSNGRTLSWWNSDILNNTDYSQIDRLIDLEKQKSNRILFYPHLAGEKTLYGDPSLRGAFVGLGADAGREELTYSVLEGLCFGFRELAEKMNLSLETLGSLKVVGGGSKSSVWMQILANVLNVPIEKMDGMIGAAFGIALLAHYRCSGADDYADMTEQTIRIERRFVPDQEMAAVCSQKYEIYKRMHDGLNYIMNGAPSVQ